MSELNSDLGLELHTAIAELARGITQLVNEEAPPTSRIQDVDLAAANPQQASDQARAKYDAAVQVDNPYAVTLELRASVDGGGTIVMRIPPRTSRVLTARVRELSLKAIGGNPAGAIPATVIRFDKPQPAGLYAYTP